MLWRTRNCTRSRRRRRTSLRRPARSTRSCRFTQTRRRSSTKSKLAYVRKVCIVGASGKLGQYMVQHALDRGYEVVGVCRDASVEKLDAFKGRITVIPGATNDREIIKRAVAGCDGVLVVLAPMGVHQNASGTAKAVLDYADPGARLVFSCGWHITRDGQDVYSWKIKVLDAVRLIAPSRRERPIVLAAPRRRA